MAPGGEAMAPGGEAVASGGESAGTGVPYGMLEVKTPLVTLAPPRAEEGASMVTLTPGLPEKREARWISTGSSDTGSSGPTELVPSPLSSCESSSHVTATIFANPVEGCTHACSEPIVLQSPTLRLWVTHVYCCIVVSSVQLG